MNRSQKIQFAENLKRLMVAKNLTLTAVAKRTGMNKSTLHNYCNGVMPRNLLKLKELADLFEVTLGDLVFEKNHAVEPQNVKCGIEGRFEITIKRIAAEEEKR